MNVRMKMREELRFRTRVREGGRKEGRVKVTGREGDMERRKER